MNNKAIILNKLKDVSPQGLCDDCLAQALDINPRQQTNQICNALAQNDVISRRKASCMQRCEKTARHKFVNFALEISPQG